MRRGRRPTGASKREERKVVGGDHQARLARDDLGDQRREEQVIHAATERFEEAARRRSRRPLRPRVGHSVKVWGEGLTGMVGKEVTPGEGGRAEVEGVEHCDRKAARACLLGERLRGGSVAPAYGAVDDHDIGTRRVSSVRHSSHHSRARPTATWGYIAINTLHAAGKWLNHSVILRRLRTSASPGSRPPEKAC
jgi:hypothetical protein